jgi:hypothetical protein
LEAKDFVINDEYRLSKGGRNDLMEKYQTTADTKNKENFRCMSPSGSNNYFKHNSKSALGFASNQNVTKPSQKISA